MAEYVSALQSMFTRLVDAFDRLPMRAAN